jgi:hypothetical protein
MRQGNRLVAFVIIVALSVVGSACGSSATAPTPNGPFVVVGHVFDFPTNAPVSGATVSFGDLESVTVLPADPRSITDGGGSYQLTLMPGQYLLWADGTYRGVARVRSGINRTDVLVHDGGCAVRYGSIADGITGRPIAGATVSLVGVSATSGPDGTYRLDFGCRGPFAFSGTIFLSISRAGYQTGSIIMGRGENLIGALRQDVDLAPQS